MAYYYDCRGAYFSGESFNLLDDALAGDKMLTELTLRNFKCWQEISSMRLAPITGLFGTNSSGKSSILQFLLMLKQTVEADDRKIVLDFGDENSRVNLGEFRDVIYGHNEDHQLGFALEWGIEKELSLVDNYQSDKGVQIASGKIIKLEVVIEQLDKGLSVKSMGYRLGSALFEMQTSGSSVSKYELTATGCDANFKFMRNKGKPWPIPSPIKFYAFPDQLYGYYQNVVFLADLQLELVQQLERVHYLGPLREYPRRYYTSKGSTPSDMGARGEYVVDAILASRERGKYISPGFKKHKKTLEERVAYWLKELGLIHSFEVAPIGKNSSIYEVKVKRTSRSTEVLITDVGFGVSQVLPIIVLCYYAEEGSTILLEQPEIHLHPSVQMGLADVFIDVMKNRNIQIILESHSEHLLNRLQRRLVEDEEFSPDDIALYFCNAGAASSSLKLLELDRFGNILNWPEGFFGDRFAEVAARQEAGVQRRLATEENS